MKSESPLAGCWEKTEWAKAEIEKLESDIREFSAANPYEIRSEADVERGQEVWRFKLSRKAPEAMAIRVGNILQNLREPLDNVLAILSDRHRGKDSSVSFPFSDTIKNYDTELVKIEKLLPAGAEELIRKAETYPGGNTHLRALHFLNRDKKHRVPIAPFNLRTGYLMESLEMVAGKVIRVGYEHGHRLVPDGRNLSAPDNASAPPFVMRDGKPYVLFEPNIAAGDDEMEFMVTTPGAKFQADIKPTVEISFSKIKGLEREPICISLHQMRQLVEGILLTFEDRFFP
jgi:hypothetical protein